MYVPKPQSAPSWRANGRDPDFENRPDLPDWHELLAAFCGHIGDGPDDHPVTCWARALAELHLHCRHHPGDAGGIDRLRAEFIDRIDGWVASRALSRGMARPESLGTVVDAMAEAHVRSVHLLRTSENASDERVHAAWCLLAQMADGWTDRAAGVVGPPIRRSA